MLAFGSCGEGIFREITSEIVDCGLQIRLNYYRDFVGEGIEDRGIWPHGDSLLEDVDSWSRRGGDVC